MKTSNHSKILNLCLVFALFISSYGLIRTYQRGKLDFIQGTNVIYRDGQVLGIDSSQATTSSDFSKQIFKGDPLIFGGAHYPKLEQQQAWDQIEDVGVTSMRSDFYMDRYLPQNISLDDYKNNVNGVQNPQNWNQKEIKVIKDAYLEAKKRNMKTIGILTYSIKWLNHSGTHYGVPKDWDVYEDLVRKSYRLYRDDIDYLEIWNEPDLSFLDLKNSGLTREDAYHLITQHAVKAIRQVDSEINDGKRMKLGVGVISQPTNYRMLTKTFADKALMSQVDFVSYHNYEHIPEPSSTLVREEMKRNGIDNLPLYLTEWAHSPDLKKQDPYVLSNLGISYAGSKFISYYNNGLAGSNYFALQQIDPDSKRGDEGYLGFFTVKDGKSTLLPIAKTFSLMSKTLNLGDGESVIFQTNPDANTKMASWKNVHNEYGIVISNDSNQPVIYNVTLNNYPASGAVLASAYIASPDHDGKKKLGSMVINNKNSQMSFKVVAPSNAVVGVKLGEPSLLDRIPTLP